MDASMLHHLCYTRKCFLTSGPLIFFLARLACFTPVGLLLEALLVMHSMLHAVWQGYLPAPETCL